MSKISSISFSCKKSTQPFFGAPALCFAVEELIAAKNEMEKNNVRNVKKRGENHQRTWKSDTKIQRVLKEEEKPRKIRAYTAAKKSTEIEMHVNCTLNMHGGNTKGIERKGVRMSIVSSDLDPNSKLYVLTVKR